MSLDILLARDLPPAPPLGWGLRLNSPAWSLMERIRELSSEVTLNMGGRFDADLPDYVTALHALVLDLVDMTGAPTTGRRSAAHAALLDDLGLVVT